MKISILQENLKKALSLTERFVSTKSQLPVLSNILLKADDNGFYLIATNLETGVKFRIGAKIEKKGAITVPVKVFSEFINTLPSGTVMLENVEEVLKVSLGSFKASFQTINASEYPEFPKSEEGKEKKISLKDLKTIAEKVGFAASSDDSRPVLTGILWDMGKSKSKLIATDGYRLSLLSLPLKSVKGEENKLLIPSFVSNEVVRVFGEIAEENVSMLWSKEQKQVFFASEDLEVVTRVLEGEFPNYQAVIPSDELIRINIRTDQLIQATKMAAIFARESANIIKWKVGKKNLEISANSPQLGENISIVEYEGEIDEEKEIAFNSRYLLDLFSHIDTEEVVFSMTEPLRPGVFYEKGKEKEFLHVVMPVRVQE